MLASFGVGCAITSSFAAAGAITVTVHEHSYADVDVDVPVPVTPTLPEEPLSIWRLIIVSPRNMGKLQLH
jgi:hypothetical protein